MALWKPRNRILIPFETLAIRTLRVGNDSLFFDYILMTFLRICYIWRR